MADDDLGQRVKRAMLALGYPWFSDQNVVSVEGMDLDGKPNANRDDAWDDWKGVLDGEGKFLFGPVTATTQPGRRWTRQPMNNGGAFIIALGPQAVWTPGDYHGHTVWRQAEDSRIMGHRDPDMTYRRNGKPISYGSIGVHHHGGYDLPRNSISDAAAGCQVIRLRMDQQAFMDLTLKCPRYLADKHNYRMTATVLTAAQVQMPVVTAPAPAPLTDVADQIATLAKRSALSNVNWSGRGKAPTGYIVGMALSYAKAMRMLADGDSTALVMAQGKASSEVDALTYYSLDTSTKQAALRSCFALLIGLGMRESSGRYCEGRDRSSNNATADTAEAGLFQQSWDSRGASPELPKLLDGWGAGTTDGMLDVFRTGVVCTAGDLQTYGIGAGAMFQRLCKSKPFFAVLCAGVGLRTIRAHWGPVNRREAEIRPEATSLLQGVERVATIAEAVKTPLRPPEGLGGPVQPPVQAPIPPPAPKITTAGKVGLGGLIAMGAAAGAAVTGGEHAYLFGGAVLVLAAILVGAVIYWTHRHE